jgi:hypothetical protein
MQDTRCDAALMQQPAPRHRLQLSLSHSWHDKSSRARIPTADAAVTCLPSPTFPSSPFLGQLWN